MHIRYVDPNSLEGALIAAFLGPLLNPAGPEPKPDQEPTLLHRDGGTGAALRGLYRGGADAFDPARGFAFSTLGGGPKTTSAPAPTPTLPMDEIDRAFSEKLERLDEAIGQLSYQQGLFFGKLHSVHEKLARIEEKLETLSRTSDVQRYLAEAQAKGDPKTGARPDTSPARAEGLIPSGVFETKLDEPKSRD